MNLQLFTVNISVYKSISDDKSLSDASRLNILTNSRYIAIDINLMDSMHTFMS